MTINVYTLHKIKTDDDIANELGEISGIYVLNFIMNDNHLVEQNIEEELIKLLQNINEYVVNCGMSPLIDIYDSFSLDQDAMIIYSVISDYFSSQRNIKFADLHTPNDQF